MYEGQWLICATFRPEERFIRPESENNYALQSREDLQNVNGKVRVARNDFAFSFIFSYKTKGYSRKVKVETRTLHLNGK